MRATSALLASVLLLLIAGCGEDDDPGGSGMDAVVATVPGDREVTAVDVAAVRRQLGLPEDTGLPRRGKRPDPAQVTLLTTLAPALTFIRSVDRDDEFVDVGTLRQVATGGLRPDERVIAVRSADGPDQVLDRLADKSWDRDGDVMSREEGDPRYAAEGRDEVVVFANERDVLERARKGDAPGGRARELVRSFDQPVRGAGTLERPATCLEAYGYGEDAEPSRGRAVVVVDRTPDPAKMGRGQKLGSATLGAARADGRRVVSRYRGGRDFDRGLIGRRLFAETLRFYALYRC